MASVWQTLPLSLHRSSPARSAARTSAPRPAGRVESKKGKEKTLQRSGLKVQRDVFPASWLITLSTSRPMVREMFSVTWL